MFRKSTSSRIFTATSLAVLLAFSTIGSASAAPVITRTGTTPFYTPSAIMTAKQGGGLPAQIIGSPSRNGPPAAAVAPLRLPATVGGGNIVPARTGRSGDIRIVLVFNGKDVSPEQVCAAPSGVETGAAKKGLDVYAALCRGKDFFSHAHLRDEAVRGVGDPRYARAMEQLLLALMPPEDRAGEDLD